MADEETVEENDEKPGKGSKKLLIIGILVGLLLGGGAGVGAFMMLGNKDNKQDTVKPKPVEEKPKLDLHFVKVKNVTIPLVANNRVLANMMFDFSLEVKSNDNKMVVIQTLPAIRDAILRHFSDTPIGKTDNPQTIDYIRLKKTIKDISNKLLHAKLVRKVMVVQVRRFP